MSLVPDVGSRKLLVDSLLSPDGVVRIGAIHRMDFHECVVLTHDRWKFEAAGLAQFSFLLATAMDVDAAGSDDDELLLLRIEGTAPLALESDLHAVREEALRNALSSSGDTSPGAVLDLSLDPFTQNRVQFTGLRCRILGTFYEEEVDGDLQLQFGADVDNFYATGSYRVFKPIGDVLSTIASFQTSRAASSELVDIGCVRYTATRRRSQSAGQAMSKVRVNIHDFIGHKTALLGMTRTGKSNTAKILIARIFAVSERARAAGSPPIGQLIFDPQGEYANSNTQDGTEIAAIGADHVRIYRFGADGSQPHVRPLGINFFDEQQIGTVQYFVSSTLGREGSSGYVRDFAQAEFTADPANPSAVNRLSRAKALLYGALLRAGFRPASGWSQRVSMKRDLAEAVRNEGIPLPDGGSGHVILNAENLVDCMNKILELKDGGNGDAERFCDDPKFEATEPIFSGRSNNRGVRGYRNLIQLRQFHNSSTSRDIGEEIYDELREGRIVIVDLHIGGEQVIQALAESITRTLLSQQTEVFTSGDDPPRIQVMLEEAHNLFSSKRYEDVSDVWVRLAKEAAKLNMGMTYATQEVSGVAHEVKANTANWVVAHLNNQRELSELARFYDFGTFSDSIISSEDRGYVRLKTLSSPYVIPVQVDRYDLDLVNEARNAAGDPSLEANPVAEGLF